MLILFDIDATLLCTQRVGVQAVADAGQQLFGPDFRHDLIQYAGGLDPVLFEQLLKANNLPSSDHEVQRFRAVYAKNLRQRLTAPNTATPLPGVVDLLDALAKLDHLALGLLTGNYPETGSAKLAAAGLDLERFSLCVWGGDSPHQPARRAHLPLVAMAQYQERFNTTIAPDRVTVVGDTEHDVHCAKVNGCRALGVATGSQSVDELLAAGADRAVDSLADTESILDWITASRTPTPESIHRTPSPAGRGPG